MHWRLRHVVIEGAHQHVLRQVPVGLGKDEPGRESPRQRALRTVRTGRTVAPRRAPAKSAHSFPLHPSGPTQAPELACTSTTTSPRGRDRSATLRVAGRSECSSLSKGAATAGAAAPSAPAIPAASRLEGAAQASATPASSSSRTWTSTRRGRRAAYTASSPRTARSTAARRRPSGSACASSTAPTTTLCGSAQLAGPKCRVVRESVLGPYAQPHLDLSAGLAAQRHAESCGAERATRRSNMAGPPSPRSASSSRASQSSASPGSSSSGW